MGPSIDCKQTDNLYRYINLLNEMGVYNWWKTAEAPICIGSEWRCSTSKPRVGCQRFGSIDRRLHGLRAIQLRNSWDPAAPSCVGGEKTFFPCNQR